MIDKLGPPSDEKQSMLDKLQSGAITNLLNFVTSQVSATNKTDFYGAILKNVNPVQSDTKGLISQISQTISSKLTQTIKTNIDKPLEQFSKITEEAGRYAAAAEQQVFLKHQLHAADFTLAITSLVEKIVGGYSAPILDSISQLAYDISKISPMLGTLVSTFAPGLLKHYFALEQKKRKTLYDKLVSTVSETGKLLNDIFGLVKDKASTIFDQFIDINKAVLNLLSGFTILGPIIEQIWPKIQPYVSATLHLVLQPITDRLGKLLKGVFGELFFKREDEQLKAVNNIASTVSGIHNLLENINTGLQLLPDKLKNAIGINKVEEKVSKVTEFYNQYVAGKSTLIGAAVGIGGAAAALKSGIPEFKLEALSNKLPEIKLPFGENKKEETAESESKERFRILKGLSIKQLPLVGGALSKVVPNVPASELIKKGIPVAALGTIGYLTLRNQQENIEKIKRIEYAKEFSQSEKISKLIWNFGEHIFGRIERPIKQFQSYLQTEKTFIQELLTNLLGEQKSKTILSKVESITEKIGTAVEFIKQNFSAQHSAVLRQFYHLARVAEYSLVALKRFPKLFTDKEFRSVFIQGVGYHLAQALKAQVEKYGEIVETISTVGQTAVKTIEKTIDKVGAYIEKYMPFLGKSIRSLNERISFEFQALLNGLNVRTQQFIRIITSDKFWLTVKENLALGGKIILTSLREQISYHLTGKKKPDKPLIEVLKDNIKTIATTLTDKLSPILKPALKRFDSAIAKGYSYFRKTIDFVKPYLEKLSFLYKPLVSLYKFFRVPPEVEHIDKQTEIIDKGLNKTVEKLDEVKDILSKIYDVLRNPKIENIQKGKLEAPAIISREREILKTSTSAKISKETKIKELQTRKFITATPQANLERIKQSTILSIQQQKSKQILTSSVERLKALRDNKKVTNVILSIPDHLKTISGNTGQLIKKFTGLTDHLKKGSGFLKSIFTKLLALGSALLGMLNNMVSRLLDGLKNILLKKAVSSVANFFNKGASSIANFFNKGTSSVANFFSKGTSGGKSILSKIVNLPGVKQVTSLLSKRLLPTIAKRAMFAIPGIGTAIGAAWTIYDILDTLGVTDWLKEKISQGFTAVREFASSVINSAKEKVSAAVNKTKEIVKKSINTAKSFASKVWKGITSFFGFGENKQKETKQQVELKQNTSLKSSIKLTESELSKRKNEVEDIQKLKSFTRSAVSTFVTSNLKKKISSAIDKTKEVIRNSIDTAKSIAKKVWSSAISFFGVGENKKQKETGQVFSGPESSVKLIESELAEKKSEIRNRTKETIRNTMQTAQSIISKAWSGITSFFKFRENNKQVEAGQVLSGPESSVKLIEPELFKKGEAKNIQQTFMGNLKAFARSAAGKFIGSVKSLLTSLKDFGANIIEKIGVSKTNETLKTKIFDKLTTFGKNFMQFLSTSIHSIAETGKKHVSKLLTRAKQFVDKVRASVKDVSIGKPVNAIINKAKTVVTTAKDHIIQTGHKIVKGVVEKVRNLKDKIVSFLFGSSETNKTTVTKDITKNIQKKVVKTAAALGVASSIAAGASVSQPPQQPVAPKDLNAIEIPTVKDLGISNIVLQEFHKTHPNVPLTRNIAESVLNYVREKVIKSEYLRIYNTLLQKFIKEQHLPTEVAKDLARDQAIELVRQKVIDLLRSHKLTLPDIKPNLTQQTSSKTPLTATPPSKSIAEPFEKVKKEAELESKATESNIEVAQHLKDIKNTLAESKTSMNNNTSSSANNIVNAQHSTSITNITSSAVSNNTNVVSQYKQNEKDSDSLLDRVVSIFRNIF